MFHECGLKVFPCAMKCCESGSEGVDHFLVHFSDGEHVGGQPVGRGLEDHGSALQVPGVLRHGAPGANVIKLFHVCNLRLLIIS